jgi:hypothetical protein
VLQEEAKKSIFCGKFTQIFYVGETHKRAKEAHVLCKPSVDMLYWKDVQEAAKKSVFYGKLS